jgi:hypothetical protein
MTIDDVKQHLIEAMVAEQLNKVGANNTLLDEKLANLRRPPRPWQSALSPPSLPPSSAPSPQATPAAPPFVSPFIAVAHATVAQASRHPCHRGTHASL